MGSPNMMGGMLCKGLPIAIDYWQPPENNENYQKRAYFMSRVPTDSSKGPTNEWKEKIFTSRLNKYIMMTKYNMNKSLFTVLEMARSYKMALPPQDGQNERPICHVTMMEANHVKGSVMFLFQGHFGNIIYTGDFRYCPEMMTNPILMELSKAKNLNLMYLDNTYEEVGFHIPTKEQALESALKIVHQHKYHRIILSGPVIGKEDVLVRVAQSSKEKILVSKTTLSVLQLLELPDVFTSDKTEASRLCFVPLEEVTAEKLKEKNREHPTIAIRLTASPPAEEARSEFIHSVPYSNHCSASELTKVLAFLRPRNVLRLLPRADPSRPSVIDDYLATCPSSDGDTSDMDDTYEEFRARDSTYTKTSAASSVESGVDDGDDDEEEDEDDDDDEDETDVDNAGLRATLARAERMIRSIEEEMDRDGPHVVHTAEFNEKLVRLARIYEPITGIPATSGHPSK